MKKSCKKRKHIILLCTVLIGPILAVWTIWGNTALMASEILIFSDRLPASFSGYRIAHVSDLHNTEFGEDNETLLQMLSESQPDIIVITGDLINAQHTDIGIALSFTKEAMKIAPTYFGIVRVIPADTIISKSLYDRYKISPNLLSNCM